MPEDTAKRLVISFKNWEADWDKGYYFSLLSLI